MMLNVSIKEKDTLPAFAAYLSPSASQGEIKIVTNISATLSACAQNPDENFYQLMAEHTVHEMLHAFQELYKRAFDENEVEEAILRGREYYEKNEIRTKEQYKAALEELDKLIDLDPLPETPESIELERLSYFIKRYEDKHYPAQGKDSQGEG